jgi:hypothetical protein
VKTVNRAVGKEKFVENIMFRQHEANTMKRNLIVMMMVVVVMMMMEMTIKEIRYYLNKSPTRCNNFPVYYPDVYLHLSMFRAFSHRK